MKKNKKGSTLGAYLFTFSEARREERKEKEEGEGRRGKGNNRMTIRTINKSYLK